MGSSTSKPQQIPQRKAQAQKETVFKILLTGNPGVGKTSLILRLTDETFSEELPSVFFLDSKTKALTVDGSEIKVTLWDYQKEERFRTSCFAHVWRSFQGVVMVYDISNRESFDRLSEFMVEIDKKARDPVKFLVGNKSDLEDRRNVPWDVAQRFADDNGYLFFEVSAKTGDKLEEMFFSVVRSLFCKKLGGENVKSKK
eukprot:TRINITY_DN13289_c0_g1_i1.p1 TRINITY_DN13289_c0_g1~~TRINITY_DN13289_c0_g1_i1.p1  ORF type:complete len:199 (+),score=34.87 TRINITY_DN13289_c0_g1_i1:55-651(+)